MAEQFHTEDSIQSPYPDRDPRWVKNGALLLAGMLAIGVAGAGVGATIAHEHDKKPNLRPELNATTLALANARAAAFTAALYDRAHYPNGVRLSRLGVSIINGEITTTLKTVSGQHTGQYKNPILLETNDSGTRPDARGKFLVGAYIGIQGSDKDGHAVITAVPYDPQTEHFIPYNSAHVILPETTGAYITRVTDAPDELVAFDTNGGEQLINGDDSLIQPGLSEGMK